MLVNWLVACVTIFGLMSYADAKKSSVPAGPSYSAEYSCGYALKDAWLALNREPGGGGRTRYDFIDRTVPAGSCDKEAAKQTYGGGPYASGLCYYDRSYTRDALIFPGKQQNDKDGFYLLDEEGTLQFFSTSDVPAQVEFFFERTHYNLRMNYNSRSNDLHVYCNLSGQNCGFRERSYEDGDFLPIIGSPVPDELFRALAIKDFHASILEVPSSWERHKEYGLQTEHKNFRKRIDNIIKNCCLIPELHPVLKALTESPNIKSDFDLKFSCNLAM